MRPIRRPSRGHKWAEAVAVRPGRCQAWPKAPSGPSSTSTDVRARLMAEIPAFGEPGAGASELDDATLARVCLDNILTNDIEKFYFKDLGSRFVRISVGQASTFGVGSVADIRGKTDFDFFTSEHAQEAYDAEQEIIRTGVPVIAVEERETWPGDRADTGMLTTKLPLRDQQGRIIGTFGLSRDITRRKE